MLNCETEFGPDWNWMPKKLTDLVPWAEKYLDLVPEAYRHSATFEPVSFRDSHRENWLNVKVHYHRPKTDEEMTAHLADEEAQEKERRKAERRMLGELQEKFSDR